MVARNLAKAWLLLIGLCALFAAIGWALGGYRVASLFLFCALLTAGGLAFYADRVALGMVGAKELPLASAPAVHSTVERLAAVAGVPKPKLYVSLTRIRAHSPRGAGRTARRSRSRTGSSAC